ncbi:MAG: CaiB/BaiF CoA transferase family protein [Nitriliruptorales bacterium]
MTDEATVGPLDGIRVLDLSTVVAGPLVARNLGDFGAEVIKVEHPRDGDPVRSMAWQIDGVSLWFKVLNRNKLPITLDLSTVRGARLCMSLAERSGVLVESFRPGTLERWGLAPGTLLANNPRLIVTRLSGFGQTGPYAQRPGFGTLAEALSGYAGIQGVEGGPPQLPGVALADHVAGLWGTVATLLALHARRRGGQGQVIDVSLCESLFALLEPLPALFNLTGQESPRLGNRLPFAAPRGAYRTSDERWLAISGTAPAVARRILLAIGGPSLADDPRFATSQARLAHAEELDALIERWVGERTLNEALTTLAAHDAAVAPVYRMRDVFADPHFSARGTIKYVADDQVEEVAMADLVPRLSATPGRVRWTGGSKGEANKRVYGGLLGLDGAELSELVSEGVI